MYSLVFARNHNRSTCAWSIPLFVIGFLLIHIVFHVLLLVTQLSVLHILDKITLPK